jgi:phage tail P2-like protein
MIPNLALSRIVNETLIDLLAWQFHVDFYEPGLPVKIKRELVLKSLDWHYRKGTPSVVEEIVSTVFSRAKIEEWYEYGGRPYRFRIATEEQKPDSDAVRKLIRAVNSVKNTRSFLDNFTHLLDFIEEIITKDVMKINVLAHFNETLEIQDGAFDILSEFSFADRVLTRSSIVYGGVKEFDRYNGVHAHNGKIVFQGYDGEFYNGVYLHNGKIVFRGYDGELYDGVYLHNGIISFKGDVSEYRHDGTVSFGSGLGDTFASDNLSVTLRIDLNDAMPSRDELAITGIANYTDRFSSARLYNSKIIHNGQYKFDAADDALEVAYTDDGDFSDTAIIEEGTIETALAADFADVEAMTEVLDPHTVTLALKETVEMDEGLALSGSMDFSDSADMADDLAIGMIGYWSYGGTDNPRYSHDGSIGFNYGIIVPV